MKTTVRRRGSCRIECRNCAHHDEVVHHGTFFDDGDYVTVQFDDTRTKTAGLKDGITIFESREALCEHYRKIFE